MMPGIASLPTNERNTAKLQRHQHNQPCTLHGSTTSAASRPAESPSVGKTVFPSPLAWCYLPSPPLGGAEFSFSSDGWRCLVSFYFAWCCVPFPPLGSGAFLLSSVGWCCLVSSPFGRCCVFPSSILEWCCCLSPPPLGAAFPLSLLFCWVVLPGFPPLGGVAVFFCGVV